MTKENQDIRDKLKAVENIIVSALAHQPENDADCRVHLLRARMDVMTAISLDAKPLRVCDVNFLESLSDYLVKTVLAADCLKDAPDCYRDIVAASVKTALRVAYEPAHPPGAVGKERRK